MVGAAVVVTSVACAEVVEAAANWPAEAVGVGVGAVVEGAVDGGAVVVAAVTDRAVLFRGEVFTAAVVAVMKAVTVCTTAVEGKAVMVEAAVGLGVKAGGPVGVGTGVVAAIVATVAGASTIVATTITPARATNGDGN